MKKIIVVLIFLCLTNAVKAQTFLNGSFEINGSGNYCVYDLLNVSFNPWMSNVYAYGAGDECDILVAGCQNPGPVPDGTWFVGLSGLVDEIAMELSAPLVSGNTYTISFWSYSAPEDFFGNLFPQGNLEIGASTINNNFGTSVHTATTVSSTWTNHTFSFVAPNNAQFITVRNVVDGVEHWNHIDHFTIVNNCNADAGTWD